MLGDLLHVVDGDRITGGGVTSGLDFAFKVLAELRGAEAAKTIQLLMEYDPAPPFQAGHPRVAEKALVNKVKEMTAPMIQGRWEVSRGGRRRRGGRCRGGLLSARSGHSG